MKKIFISGAFTLVALLVFWVGIVFAQNQVVLPNAGLTPESPFYFLDKFGEALRTFFTFNPEGKARLQITFAAERVAEIKIILETKGIEAKGLDVAQSRLQVHLANAATIVTDQKAKGKDVSQLAKELDDEFEGPKTALEETFKAKERTLEAQEDELKAKIKEARRAGDTAQAEAIAKQLGEVKAQKELLEQEADDQEEALEKEEERIKEEMEAKEKAEKAIREAEKERQEVLGEASEGGLTVPAEAFGKFDGLLAQAKSALAAGNYPEAKHLAKQAEKSLDEVEKAVKDLEEAKEKEEELKEEQEEKEREAKEKQEELKKEDVEKEAERLEKEREKAEEEVRKAEERLREAGKVEEEEEKEEKEEEMKPEEGNDTSSIQTPRIEIVTIRSDRFDDNVVDIRRGDTIRWINGDSQPHWPASNVHPVHTDLPGFDALRPLGQGETYEFTFTKSGTFGYHDHLNPSVTGKVIVK